MTLKQAQITLIAAALAAMPSGLSAQTLRGTVVDSASTTPLGSVTIELLQLDSLLVERVSSDEAGKFVVRVPEPGRYRLRVQLIGYRPYESPIALPAREVNIPNQLSAIPVRLAPVRVEAQRDEFLVHRGYYMRKESEAGTFMDPPEVEKLASKARLVGDILERIPGVRMTVAAGSGGIRVPHLRGCRAGIRGGAGFPRLLLDGVETGADAFASLLPSHILAVEVYLGPAQIPLVYGGTGSPCGVIVVWTKR